MIECNGKTYTSQKFPLLEYIFRKYNPNNDVSITSIPFSLADISEAYDNLVITRVSSKRTTTVVKPTSTSNTILDLVRKDNGIERRLPQSIIDLGYDIRKKTGIIDSENNYAGEFVYVGVGNTLHSWFEWPTDMINRTLSSIPIPSFVKPHLRRDEGGLFSVMDYCDVMSIALYNVPNMVFRVQHPLKWQPNEIDGFYMAELDNFVTLFPVEAKSLATEDDINLDQILGGAQTASREFSDVHAHIIPIAVQMTINGLRLAIFKSFESSIYPDSVEVDKAYQFSFSPPIVSWQ